VLTFAPRRCTKMEKRFVRPSHESRCSVFLLELDTDPAHGCVAPNCSWVPAGIAVHRYFGKKENTVKF